MLHSVGMFSFFSRFSVPLAPHIFLGRRGEAIAARELGRRGLKIFARNVRIGKDEIDLLAFDPKDDVLVFVEVKTRRVHSDEYDPAMNAGFHKRRKLLRAARRWVAMHDYDGGYRLDIVCVEEGRVTEHLREVAWQPSP